MDQAQQRLIHLLEAGEISEADYILLLGALNKRLPAKSIIYDLIINPFQKIAGTTALALGFITILLISCLSKQVSVGPKGALGFRPQTTADHFHFNFITVLEQNLSSCIGLACIFLLAALIWKPKGLRITDFLGMVMLAKFPQLFILICLNIFSLFHHNFVISLHDPDSILLHVLRLSYFISLIWCAVLYFNAFKTASGLTGYKLWLSFCVAIAVGDSLSVFLINQFS